MALAEGELLRIEVVWSPRAGCVSSERLTLPGGSTVAQALEACRGFGVDRAAIEALGSLRLAIWGRLQSADAPLRMGDRVEVLRPLTVDPKEARRVRYRATGRRIASRHRPLPKSEGG